MHVVRVVRLHSRFWIAQDQARTAYLYKPVGDEGVLLLAVALRGRFVACDVYGLQLPAPAAESRSKNWGKQMVRECGRVRHQLHLGTRPVFIIFFSLYFPPLSFFAPFASFFFF